jgi:transcription elongation factor GreA
MTVQKPVPITQQGLERLQGELDDLVTVKRAANAERIHQIREQAPTIKGDGEFEEAKNAQAFTEGRILTIEKILANIELIDESLAHDASAVHLGATVAVTIGGKVQEFTIVGMPEVDPAHGFVSDESPVGRALLGHKVGETVEADAPAGKIKIKIKSIL